MKTSISILFLAVLLFSIAGICHATPMYLSLNGTAQAVIVDDANATAAEETAATELQSYLNQITGGSFQIVSSAPPNTPRILIGATTEARSLAPDVNWNALGSDGIVIRRVPGTNTLILAGGRPRGTLWEVLSCTLPQRMHIRQQAGPLLILAYGIPVRIHMYCPLQ